jgi:glyoxylase-like metal-dependent hydrolase (beta-lactamase superfamily II)
MSSSLPPAPQEFLACPVPEPGSLAEVAPGVRWLRMPLPFALDHINLWVLDDRDAQDEPGLTLVDSGLGNATTRALWEEIFAGPLAGCRVLRLICTHFHPDHMGLSAWLCERFGVRLHTTFSEWAMGHLITSAAHPWSDDLQGAFYRLNGASAADCAALKERAEGYRTRASAPPLVYHRLYDGDQLAIGERLWRVVVGYGHAPEQACLLGLPRDPAADDQQQPVFIAGDQVLPQITPNISVWPNDPDANPLAAYMSSLAHIRQTVPDHCLVLPSHRQPFSGLHGRIDSLIAHHDERLETVYHACAEPCTAVDLLPILFRRSLDAHQLGFALGESLAHLHYLWQAGRLQRFADDHGTLRFVHPSRWKPAYA